MKPNAPHRVQCHLCGKIFVRRSARGAASSMRNHRRSRHPTHHGPISYGLITPH